MRRPIRRLLFPPRCRLCRTLIDWYGDEVFCDDCVEQWNATGEEICGYCAKPVRECLCMPEALERAKCEALCKLCYYHPNRERHPQNRVLYHLKKSNDGDTADAMIDRMLPEIQKLLEGNDAPVLVTYIPRTARAMREFGIDQARLLGAALARGLGVRLLRLLCRRGGTQQKDLSPAARMRNARASLRRTRTAIPKGAVVFLVDDIVTTGAGMAVGTRLLRRAGAGRVIALSLAVDASNQEAQ